MASKILAMYLCTTFPYLTNTFTIVNFFYKQQYADRQPVITLCVTEKSCTSLQGDSDSDGAL